MPLRFGYDLNYLYIFIYINCPKPFPLQPTFPQMSKRSSLENLQAIWSKSKAPTFQPWNSNIHWNDDVVEYNSRQKAAGRFPDLIDFSASAKARGRCYPYSDHPFSPPFQNRLLILEYGRHRLICQILFSKARVHLGIFIDQHIVLAYSY